MCEGVGDPSYDADVDCRGNAAGAAAPSAGAGFRHKLVVLLFAPRR